MTRFSACGVAAPDSGSKSYGLMPATRNCGRQKR